MKHILIIDEDRDACAAATAALRAFDCEVEIVTDGRDVMEPLRHRRPDAVLVGLGIPAMAGSALVDVCRRAPVYADVPIVVMGSTPEAAIDAIRAGAHGFVRKPVEVGGVVAALPEVLCSPKRGTAPTTPRGRPATTPWGVVRNSTWRETRT